MDPHWPDYSLSQKRTPLTREHWWRCTSPWKQFTENLFSGIPGTQSKTTWTNQAAWRKFYIFFLLLFLKLKDFGHVRYFNFVTSPRSPKTDMTYSDTYGQSLHWYFQRNTTFLFFSPGSKAWSLSGPSQDSLSQMKNINQTDTKGNPYRCFCLDTNMWKMATQQMGTQKQKSIASWKFSAFFAKTCRLWN